MSTVGQIINGTIKNILNQEDALYQERIAICRACPLLKQDSLFGEICNPTLYMNSKGEVSQTARPGFQHGCGCVLRSKCRVKEAECPLHR